MPPPTIYCTGSGVGNEFTVATRGLFRYLGESSEIIHRASAVSVTGQLNCVPGAPPLDSGLPDVAVIGDDTGTRTDASIDANFDGGTPDATGSDALTDIGRDANPCPGPAELDAARSAFSSAPTSITAARAVARAQRCPTRTAHAKWAIAGCAA